MTQEQKNIILTTVPVLKEHGVTLTTHFYKRMFEHNPELKNLFNMGNQQSGKQQTALALAVLAYAENIADPGVLAPVVDRIGHKHTSLAIEPAQYLIVGEHLLAAIAEVLGEAATPAILDAWETAYHQLASLMTGHEANLYKRQLEQKNGWNGWRQFTVGQKIKESAEISSFYLYPADGGKVMRHQPGQYISIRLFLPELNLNQIRQYSLSSSPNDRYYRISVKREVHPNPDINGMISNRLHDAIEEGATVEITAPAGNFLLPKNQDAPLMFISGGVGLTPFVSMVHELADKNYAQPVTWVHGCRNDSVHAFKAQLEHLVAENDYICQHIFYNQPTQEDLNGGIYPGHVDLNAIKELEHIPGTRYYICGPAVFIQKQIKDLQALGIESGSIFYEEFGPQVLQLN